MRQKHTIQASLFDPELVDHPEAAMYLRRSLPGPTRIQNCSMRWRSTLALRLGTGGLSCETALRCAVLRHLRQETWRGLAFSLRDSARTPFGMGGPGRGAEEVGPAGNRGCRVPRYLGADQSLPVECRLA